MVAITRISLMPNQELSIIRDGLRKTSHPKNIIIVGAGMAGLVAASLLKDAGHHVKIIEASERVGGRVHTIRSPFSSGLYYDAGAMRIPDVHYSVIEYIKKFKLPMNQFINSTPEDIIYVNGIKARLKEYTQQPAILNYPLAPGEHGKTAIQLLGVALQPIINFINENPRKNWPIFIKKYDGYSMSSFLRHFPFNKGMAYSDGAIEMMAVILDMEGLMEMSFIEIMRDVMIFMKPMTRYLGSIEPFKTFYEIQGGNDRLPTAFLPQLKDNIIFSQRMEKISQQASSVTIGTIDSKTSEHRQITADLAIVTVPFSLLRLVAVEPHQSFHHNKWKAIRELRYMESTKIAIEFKSRFWEKQGLLGGKSVTDLPVRFVYYPSHGIGAQGPAVVIASYTWGSDALPWIGLTNEQRIQYALRNLTTLHGDQVYHEFVTGDSHSWVTDNYAGGGFSFLKPEQQTQLYPYTFTPEGRVHFAGVHTSQTPDWIQGAINSGIGVAYEVNELPK